MPEQDFLPFATGVGANVEDQVSWAADPVVVNGFVNGIADPKQVNKGLRQASVVASAWAFLAANILQENVLDNGNVLNFTQQLMRAAMGVGYFVDSGVDSAMIVTAPFGLTLPAPTVGLRTSVRVNVINTSITGVTLNWMGHGNLPVVYPDGTPLFPGDLPGSGIVQLEFDGTNWQMLSLSPRAVRNNVGRLIANKTIYIRSTGNDANNGSSPSQAFLTIAAARLFAAETLDANGFNVVFDIGAGDFLGATIFGQLRGCLRGGEQYVGAGIGVTIIHGPGAASGHALGAVNSAQISVSNLSVTTTVGGAGLFSQGLAAIDFSGVEFRDCASAMLESSLFGQITTSGAANQILGSSNIFAWSTLQGSIFLGTVAGQHLTVTGAPTFATAFALTDMLGAISASNIIDGNAAAGKRYSGFANSIINTSGAGASYFPGTIAGTVTTGALYL